MYSKGVADGIIAKGEFESGPVALFLTGGNERNMTDGDQRYDAIVVGAGVAGCAATRELAADRDVLLLDKGSVAGEASGLAAGLIAPTLFYSDHPAVARHANECFRAFDGTCGFEFNERQRIELRLPEHEKQAREKAQRLADEGFPVSFIEADEATEQYPRFDFSRFCGIVEYRDTGWVDPHTYTVALKNDAIDRGADVETGVAVESVLTDDGAVTGVATNNGSYRASNVVFSTGWRTKELVSEYLTLPLVPFKLQCVTLDPQDAIDVTFPLGRVASEELYFRPEHNGTVLFGGGEYIETDPQTAVNGGDIDAPFRDHVARTVPEFLEGFENAELVNGWSGIDSATPDARPIIDAPDEMPDGLILSTGYNGLGMVSSPIAGTAVRSLVTGESCPFPLEPFSYGRFETVQEEFELYGTFEATQE